VNDIPDRTRRDPANFLAIGRTIMANERTLLAFLRTSLAFFLVGGGLIKFLNHPVLDAIGWIFAENLARLASPLLKYPERSANGNEREQRQASNQCQPVQCTRNF